MNIVFDIFFRLTSRKYRPETDESLNILTTVHYFSINLVEMSSEFRQRLLNSYQEPRWTRVLQIIRKNQIFDENVVKLLYRLIDEILYFDNNEKDLRLYISSTIKVEVFKLVYNEIDHSDYIRIYKKLIEGFYIFGIIIKLHKFLRYYLHYQLN